MSGLLIALDNYLVMRLVGVGETWRRIFAKCVLKVTGTRSTNTCQDDHICDGSKAGIDGAVHGIQYILDANLYTENWDFLLVYAKNAFNETNRIGMLWIVCHLWPSVACFVFNCYCHWSSLVLQNGNGMAIFLHSREGVR